MRFGRGFVFPRCVAESLKGLVSPIGVVALPEGEGTHHMIHDLPLQVVLSVGQAGINSETSLA